MTIKQRLILLAATAMTGMLILAGTNYFQTRQVFERTNFANINGVPSLLALNHIATNFGLAREYIYRHLVATTPEDMDQASTRIQASRQGVDEGFTTYDALLANDEDRRLINTLRASFKEYRPQIDEVIRLSRENRKEEARQKLTELIPLADRITQNIGALLVLNEKLGKESADDAARTMSSASTLALILLLATAGVSAFNSLQTIRTIQVRLAEANRCASRIAGGDLTPGQTRPRGGDEIGQVLQSLEAMRADLAHTIGDIMTHSGRVTDSADILSTAARQVSISSEHQASATAAAAAAVEELTVSIDHVSGNAGEATSQAREAGHLASNSARDVDAATRSSIQVSEQVESTAGQIQTLSEQVQQIDKITVVIREVADQTNLLALNAAIEAARAGEQGRGFAVVADEVRKLAERTTSSVQEISTVISTIQQGATGAVSSMQSSRTLVGEVVATASQASASMDSIRQSASTVQQAIGSISDALGEQRGAATELARSVESIAQMSEENSAAVHSVAGTAERLVEVAGSLRTSVSRFRI
ncbi:methyl-accepting chemotaxis protein [Zoogloea sp.]|uniref:methyl-accepting chemotaxis protein n=1 Tax=Zoogloea sp. TaxID=49181 RepID=UPI0026367620|nr:methyl-accepting chemotaxis protein [Zoogloea sp.]MDD3352302.1 methyl-accepting chemotaxis protein [Zoogloea sp.]